MKINIHKSMFLPSKNLSRQKVAKFEGMINFQPTYNIRKYLGLPLLSGKITNSNVSYIIDKINS